MHVTSLYDNSILALNTEGTKKPAQWVGHISSVVVNVFDLFRPEYAQPDSTFLLRSQPHFNPNVGNERQFINSAFVQRTNNGQWFAMSGRNFPSMVRSAPLSVWSEQHPNVFSSREELFNSILGVHTGSSNAQKSVQSEQLLIDGGLASNKGSEFAPKFQYQYDYRDQVYRPSRKISRSSPPNPLPPTPPQPPKESIQKFHIWASVLRILENALAFIVFFLFLLLAARYGWLNQAGLSQLSDKLQPLLEENYTSEKEVTVLDGTVTPRSLELDSEKTVLSPVTPITTERHVEIVEPEQKPTSEATTPSTQKKRKRGSRGGRKNGAKKKEKEEQLLLAANNELPLTPEPAGTQIGLLNVSTEVIGYGSHGTVVLKGTFENREVAVKRMLLDFYEVASQEVSLLQESDDNPNVIRYFCKQASDRFLYIALELCPGTLEDLIEKPDMFSESTLTPVQFLYQIASGVHHLHCLKIVHRDIKPQNILVAPAKFPVGNQEKQAGSSVRMLISDFGLCKKLEGDQSSFRATTANAAGTSGWRAPELLLDEVDVSQTHSTVTSTGLDVTSSSELLVFDSLSNRRATRSIDIFSMGCVFYYILSKGQHPFGDKYLREANIVQGNFSLECLEDWTQPDMVEAHDLVSRMISRDPSERPSAKSVLKHPLFWPPDRRLDFLLKASDRFDIEPRDPPSAFLVELESHASKVVGTDFQSQLDTEFVDNLGKYRKYHGDRITDLLRAMRNKSHHFNDLPASLQEAMHPYPSGYLGYFTTRFPFLLMTIYCTVKESELASETMFASFF